MNLEVTAFKELVAGLLTAFPDFQIRVGDQMISGDKIATRWIAKGTYNKPLGETNPTGIQAQFEGLIFDHVVGEQVVECREQWARMGMLQQPGLV